MRYAVLVVLPPTQDEMAKLTPAQLAGEWDSFTTDPTVPEAIRSAPREWQLGEGLWQIPLAEGLQTLATLVKWCQECKKSYRTLFLDEAPEWSVFDAKRF